MVSREKITSGRALQKRRTRRAVLEAAHRVLARGEKPHMTAVAREAEVSRATIYRYFPNEEVLLIEATLDGLVPDLDAVIVKSGESLGVRAAGLTQALYDHAADNEPAFRMYLRAVLEAMTTDSGSEHTSRGGRRIDAYAALLEPARSSLDQRTYDNLKFALSALTGIEALIVMKDVCQLSEKRGREVLTWAAETLVEAALERP